MSLEKVVYTAKAKATGGRDGRATSSDGVLDVKLGVPKEMGGMGGEVGIGPLPTGFGIEAKLNIHVEGMDPAEAKKLVDAAHIVCPYSNATRGNIDVTLNIIA